MILNKLKVRLVELKLALDRWPHLFEVDEEDGIKYFNEFDGLNDNWYESWPEYILAIVDADDNPLITRIGHKEFKQWAD